MKITVNRTDIFNCLSKSIKAIKPNAIIPALNHFHFEVNKDNLLITGGNMDTFISCRCNCESNTTGIFMLPATRIHNLIRDLPEQPLKLEIKDNSCKIITSNGNYTIPIETEGYPNMDQAGGISFKMQSEDFISMVDFSLPFFDNGDVDIRTGLLCIEIEKNIISATATDKNTLSHIENEIAADDCSFLISYASAKILSQLEIKGEAEISIDNNLIISTEDTRFITRTSSETYFNYKSIMLELLNKLVIDSSLLTGAIKRLYSFASPGDVDLYPLKFNINPNQIEISGSNVNFSEEGKETLICDYDGSNVEIGLSAKYMLAALSKCENIVNIEFELVSKPVIFRLDNAFILVMPTIL